MYISIENIDRFCEENDIINELLSLDNKHIIELGCGKAELTRDIATSGTRRRVTAFEIDAIQHAENDKVSNLPNVSFKHGAAENIAMEDNVADVAFMFKSLHHVAVTSMDEAFSELHRVLKKDGYLYISEPIFSGDFNDILRLFHNEEVVRAAAFNAEKKAINAGLFKLVKQVFFNVSMHFDDFAAFENLVLGVTHTNFVLSPEVFREVKTKFEKHIDDDGVNFSMPVRVDLLQNTK